MQRLKNARKLANYLKENFDFSLSIEVPERKYNHIGCLLADSVLQAGLNYKTVVLPRVQEISSDYPQALTLTAFAKVLKINGSKEVLRWNHSEKPKRLEELVDFFINEKIETTDDLSRWLQDKANIKQLLRINGIGPKTVDYIKMLTGIPEIPIDRHLKKIIREAEITENQYSEIHKLYTFAADLLSIKKSTLDWILWDTRTKKA